MMAANNLGEIAPLLTPEQRVAIDFLNTPERKRQMAESMPKGTAVYTRDGRTKGLTTGSFRHCGLDGCTGMRVYVRWPDGHLTMPCADGLVEYEDGFRIR